MINDTGEQQFCGDDDSRCGSGTKTRDRQDGNDNECGSQDTSSPGPPWSLGDHEGKVGWWTALDFDQEVDGRGNGTNAEDDGG